MSKSMPTIQKFMTVQPHTIESDQSVQDAQKSLKTWGVRHLPVTQNNTLCGIVSDRDIKLALSIQGADPSAMQVKDILVPHPYEVSPDTPLNEIAAEMAERRYGCAIVTQNNKVVGIFTTVDACRVLSDTLNTRFH